MTGAHTLTTPRARLAAAAPWAEPAMKGRWQRDEQLIAASVSDFVAEFNSVAALQIPYARLPRRWSPYAEEFPRWSDIADQTIESLLGRPKLGETAIGALIDIARESVRAHLDNPASDQTCAAQAIATLLARLDESDRALLVGRHWTWSPTPLPTLADQLHRSQASISRNTPRAHRRFRELLSDPAHHAVTQYAGRLREHLGPYTRLAAAEVEITQLGLTPDTVAAHVLLDIAGPYTLHQGWIQNLAIDGKARVAAAVDALFAYHPAAQPHLLVEALTTVGMTDAIAEEYLQTHERLRSIGEVCVRWRGDNAANITEDILSALGAPATAEDIHTLVDSSTVKLSTVKHALINEDRFIRASRTTWGLRIWGGLHYRGIAHAIGERIDAHAGTITIDALTAELVAMYPDISTESIATNLSTPAFVVARGVARRRRRGDRWPSVPPLNQARGVFLHGDNELRLAFPVGRELLRGSGQYVHRAVAAAAGVRPAKHRTFTGPDGSVTLRWELASTRGPEFGSLRALASAVGATIGDHLVLALRPRGRTLAAAQRVSAADDLRTQLESLLGHRIEDPAAAVAQALDCPRGDAVTMLRRRGDLYWANIIE
ncbi:hypothetical protein QN239_32445 [Mycolicibacterium sp. Y3]